MLGKDTGRVHIFDHSKYADLRPLLNRSLDANVLQDRRSTSSGQDSSNDIAKGMSDKVSFLSEGTTSLKMTAATWLSNALLRQQSSSSVVDSDEGNKKWCGCQADSQCVHSNFLRLQTQPAGVPTSSVVNTVTGTQWLSKPVSLVNEQHPGASTATA
eukprot:c14537_g2_i1 orf=854-1324(+)